MSENKKSFIVLLLSWCIGLYAMPLSAEEKSVDKFRIALGSYTLTRNENEIALTDPDIGAGVYINPQETLGVTSDQTVFRLDGRYRFNNKHSLIFSWYKISSYGNKSIEEQIDWIDENGDPITIPIGASVNTELVYDIYRVGYLWSFYHSSAVELSVGAGLHVTRITVGLNTQTTSSGIDAQNVSATVPLPVFSFALNYNITPKFGWFLTSEIFGLKFDDWDGTYQDATIGLEYHAWKAVGVGIGLGSNSLKVVEKTSDYKLSFANRITGLSVFVSGYF